MQRDCLITRIFRLARRPGVRDRLVPNTSIQHHPTLVLRIGGSKQTIISETRAVRRHTELNTLTPTRSSPPDPDTPCALECRVSTPCGRAQFARRGTLQNTHSKSTNRLRSLRKFLRNKRRVVIAALPALPSKTNKFHPTDVHSSTSYAITETLPGHVSGGPMSASGPLPIFRGKQRSNAEKRRRNIQR